jgi:hypothetical protein
MALEYVLTVKDNGTAVLKKVGDQVNVLHQNFTKIDKVVNVFNKSMSKLSGAISGYAGIMMAKASSEVIKLAKGMVDAYDSASKLSQNIGIASESVMGLRYAAELGGVGAEAMDKHLEKLSNTMFEAASGSKKAQESFDRLSISVKNSDGSLKKSDQVLMEMADKFKRLPPGAERAAAAIDIFGKSGAGMVSMLKDGSEALREMTNEGADAAGNVDGISDAMARLNDTATTAKTALMGMMAEIANTELFDGFVSVLREITGSILEWNKARKAGAEEEKIKNMEKLTEAAKEEAKQLLASAAAASDSKEEKKALKKADEAAWEQAKLSVKLEKARVSEAERYKLQLEGMKRAYKEAKEAGADKESLNHLATRIKFQKDMVDDIKAEVQAKAEAAAADAAALVNAERLAREQEERERKAEAEAKRRAEEARRLLEQQIKDKESAIQKLADFDIQLSIKFLEGEKKKQAELLANYEKQKKEIEDLHKKELFRAKNTEETAAAQKERMLAMERQFETEKRAIMDEEEGKKKDAIRKIADFDAELRIKSLEGEEKKQAELLASYEKQKREIEDLHKEELLRLENAEEAESAQKERLLAMERQFEAEKRAIAQEEEKEKEKRHKNELDRIWRERDEKMAAGAASMQALQSITAGYKSYNAIYKTAAIGEATINASQAVLKTMSRVAFPLNVPLAALQAAAGAVQVRKISAAKMFGGGMIPGRNTLIQANEEGREAILNTMAVRAVGGPPGVEALNSGIYNNNYSYDNRQTQSSTIVIHAALLSQKTLRDEIQPALRWQQRRL